MTRLGEHLATHLGNARLSVEQRVADIEEDRTKWGVRHFR